MPGIREVLRRAARACALLPVLLGCDGVAEPEASLEIVPDSVTLTHLGERFAFTVRGGRAEVWVSQDTTVFAVDADGAVEARGNGVAYVRAWNPRASGRAWVEVRQAVAALETIGSGQRSSAALPLLEPVGVRALDAGGAPVARVPVRFEPGAGSGRVEPGLAATDSLGVATVAWTLGRAPGRQTLRAVAGEAGASVEIAATARDPGEAASSVELRSGEGQWALGGRALPDSVAVRVLDEAGRPVWGAAVRFDPDPGSGRADPGLAATDSLGVAAAAWTLGERLGAQRLVATMARGLTLAFEATAVSDEGVCNRTPEVSTAIAGGPNCAEVTAEMLARIPRLNLDGRGIRRLGSGDFDGLSALEMLYLHGNQLSELPPDIFRGLSRLQTLNLTDNRLTRLPPDVFKGLTRLKYLYLGHNGLRELAPGTFADLTELRDLLVHYNDVTELPEDLFAGTPNLEGLNLLGNRLASLPERIFAGLSKLGKVYLSRNHLTDLPPGLFSETPALYRIKLDYNPLASLPPGLFSETPSLERLYLQRTWLTSLPEGIFDGLPALVRLDLKHNGLRELPRGVFAQTPSLAELDLYNNRLEALPRGVFAGLSKLRWVTLDSNPGAPFPVRPEFARIDADDVLAPGPARVVVRVPLGAPFALDFPVSVQRGTSSHEVVSLLPGDTASAPFTVSAAGGGAAHVGFGPPPAAAGAGYQGSLEPARGAELVLFAASDNRSPVIRSRIPAHRMQAGGPSAEVALGEHFGDPDGDALAYEVSAEAEGVVEARIENGVLRLDPVSVDTAEIVVTAVDPGGLRAEERFRTWVVPAPDPDAFNIELYFEPGFTAAEEATIRRAADRWMEAVTGDLPDVPVVDGTLLRRCWDEPSGLRWVGVIDDVRIRMRIASDLGGAAANASRCGEREESGLPFLGRNNFQLWYLRNYGPDQLYELAMHEIGHVLGIGYWPLRDVDTDPHFAGPLAVAAFDAAGGEGYAGGKVPVEDVRRRFGGGVRLKHWRMSVIPGDVMSTSNGGLTAITLGALADMGYEVDLGKADPYTLPMAAQGDMALTADADDPGAEMLADDVVRGPVVVVDRDGKVVRIIRP